MSYTSQPSECDHLLICRGLCSIGVLMAHMFTWEYATIPCLEETLRTCGIPFLTALTLIWPKTGGNFVEVFFILSGYLMGKVFWEGRYTVTRSDTIRFYKNRFLRIAPLLYFSLFVLICLGGRFYQAIGAPFALFGDLFFVNNLTGRAINPVTWSLSYEMQYYLVCPFVFWLLHGAGASKAVLTFTGTVALFCFSVLFTTLGDPLWLTPLRFTWLFLGGFSINRSVRLLHEGHGLTKNRPLTILAYVSFGATHAAYYALINVHWDKEMAAYSWHIASLVLFAGTYATLMILELPDAPGRTTPRPGPIPVALTWGGRISYGVYLWHLPIVNSVLGNESFTPVALKLLGWLAPLGSTPWEHIVFVLFWFIVCLCLTAGLSLATFYLVEVGFRPNLYFMAHGGGPKAPPKAQ